MHEPEHEALESSNGFTQGTISLELLGAAATRGVLGYTKTFLGAHKGWLEELQEFSALDWKERIEGFGRSGQALLGVTGKDRLIGNKLGAGTRPGRGGRFFRV